MKQGTSCKTRRCPAFAPIWAGDWYQVFRQGLDTYTDRHGDRARVMIGMLTAPGAGVLPWDEDHCGHLGPHRHAGPLGCRIERSAVEEWNHTAPKRAARLHWAAMRRARKVHPDFWVMALAWEPQKRGAIHRHPILPYTTPQERAGADLYVRTLGELAPGYGFGRESGLRAKTKDGRGPSVLTGSRAAAYVTSYLVDKSPKGKRTPQQWVTGHDPLPSRLFWLSPKLTKRSGVTMRTLRARRYRWYLVERLGCTEHNGWLVDAEGQPRLHLSTVYPGLFPPP